MRISVVITLLNEEQSVERLLESLLVQSVKADEIVVVDGGSSDRTAEIVKEYTKRDSRMKLFVEKGTIAHGRNTAVKKAKGEITAQTDGGCVANKDWLEKISKPFCDKSVGLVAGFYRMTGESNFQKAAKLYFGVSEREYDPRCFMPSGRSVAFRKSVWKAVGGYSEVLERAGEDTLFNYKILRRGVRIYREKEALVGWEVPRTFREAMKKLYYYAKGDAQAAIWWHPAQKLETHAIRIASVFGRYLIAIILIAVSFKTTIFFCLFIVLLFFYMTWAIHKAEGEELDMRAKAWLPVLQIGSDLMVMAGFASGMLGKLPAQKSV